MPFVIAGLFSLLGAVSTDCDWLIEANSQSLRLIRTIDVTYTITKNNNPNARTCETSWTREGRKERIRRVGGHLEPTPDGRPRDIDDLLILDSTYRYLRNWDPKSPQRISPTNQGTVRATTGPRTAQNAFLIAPSQQLLFEVDDMPRRTLQELARVASSVECKGKVEVEGRDLWLLQLQMPDESTSTGPNRFFEVFLDPRAGYMVRRITVKMPKLQMGSGQTTEVDIVREVVEFRDFGDGIFVPTRLRFGTREEWLSELSVNTVRVNERVPAEAFELEWPKYAKIVHEPPVRGRYRVEVWGDGKPIAEIAKAGDSVTLEANLRKDPRIAAELGPEVGPAPPPPMSALVKLFVALATLVALMIALVIRRRLREQAAA